VIAFSAVSLGLIYLCFRYVDRPAALWLHKFEKSAATGFFRALSDGAVSILLIALPVLATVVLFLLARLVRDPRRARELARGAGQAFFVFCCTALPPAIGLGLRIVIGRARPRILFDGNVYGFTPMNFNYDWHSMPPVHSLVAAGFAAGLALILPLPAFPVIAFCGALLALASVATTAHYFGDAVAAGALAIICAIVIKSAFRGAGSRKIFPTWDPNKKLRLRSISRSMRRR
jgi:hypothetical protein